MTMVIKQLTTGISISQFGFKAIEQQIQDENLNSQGNEPMNSGGQNSKSVKKVEKKDLTEDLKTLKKEIENINDEKSLYDYIFDEDGNKKEKYLSEVKNIKKIIKHEKTEGKNFYMPNTNYIYLYVLGLIDVKKITNDEYNQEYQITIKNHNLLNLNKTSKFGLSLVFGVVLVGGYMLTKKKTPNTSSKNQKIKASKPIKIKEEKALKIKEDKIKASKPAKIEKTKASKVEKIKEVKVSKPAKIKEEKILKIKEDKIQAPKVEKVKEAKAPKVEKVKEAKAPKVEKVKAVKAPKTAKIDKKSIECKCTKVHRS